MTKKKSYVKDRGVFGGGYQIVCELCGEEDRSKIFVEDIGISVGVGGRSYSFCKKCWKSKELGKKLLKMLGFEHGIKLKDEMVKHEG